MIDSEMNTRKGRWTGGGQRGSGLARAGVRLLLLLACVRAGVCAHNARAPPRVPVLGRLALRGGGEPEGRRSRGAEGRRGSAPGARRQGASDHAAAGPGAGAWTQDAAAAEAGDAQAAKAPRGPRAGTKPCRVVLECETSTEGHTALITCLEYRRGCVYTGSIDGALRVWDALSGKCLHVLLRYVEGSGEPPGYVTSLVCSYTHALLVTRAALSYCDAERDRGGCERRGES